jgi:hypothetical protein
MYGFLVLLPLTLISLGIGWFISSSPQVADYIQYATDIPNQTARVHEVWVNQRLWAQMAAHVLAYAVLCFALVATVRTISAPLPADRPAGLRRFQLFLELVFVSLPSTVMLWIIGRDLYGDWQNLIDWFAVGVLCVGLIISITITAWRLPLELYDSFAPPNQTTKTDMVAALCAILIVATIAAFGTYPRYSVYLVGMFPVLMLVTAATFLAIAAIFSRHGSPVAVVSSLITGVLLLHLIDQTFFPAREFRHEKVSLSSGGKLTVKEAKELRKIPDLTTAFRQWLEYRRPAIEEYKKQGKTYPVFFVSAQGGGMYAAYHPAISLARLADWCPEFAHHLFGMSSVSGGSLGAAVFAELMRTLSPAERGDPASPVVGCSRTRGPEEYQVLQRKVDAFFGTDFLSPVIASALLVDAPTILVPQLRFGYDRARALEDGFEGAWQKLALSGPDAGLSSDFLGRWDPAIAAPALFMSTTAVNFGIPVLISQVDWSYNPSAGVVTRRTPRDVGAMLQVEGSGLLQTVRDRLERPDDELQIGIANMLDFRPDVQLATSTAVVLSARFPFVTPPGTIAKNEQITVSPGGIYQKIRELQLTDGGFYDNSGGIVAREIIHHLRRQLDHDPGLQPFKNDVKFHLIRFTDTPAKRQAIASEKAHIEIVAPLAAYDAVRLSRGVVLATPAGTTVSNIYLLDEWYEGTLNWLLSETTKTNINKRSSWLKGAGNEVCCEVEHSAHPGRRERMPLEGHKEELERADPNLKLTPFVPNAEHFEKIFSFLETGVPPTVRRPLRSPPAAPPAPTSMPNTAPTLPMLAPTQVVPEK